MNIQPLNLKQKSLDSFVKTKSTRVTKEAEEALAVQLHLDGLKHLNEGNLDLAKESFHLLLQSSFLADCKAKDVGGEETSASKALDSISLKLEYSCLKNLGLIALEESQDSTALSHFLQACELDRTDVTLLQHLANTAMRLGDFMIARHALEQNVHLSPSHWPSLSALCRLLFAIEDYPACLNLLLTALEAKEDYEEGLCYLQWIMENRPYLCHGQIELWKYTCKAAPSVYDKVMSYCLLNF
jgi:tetratricopeptide (TPR) repeat protein